MANVSDLTYDLLTISAEQARGLRRVGIYMEDCQLAGDDEAEPAADHTGATSSATSRRCSPR